MTAKERARRAKIAQEHGFENLMGQVELARQAAEDVADGLFDALDRFTVDQDAIEQHNPGLLDNLRKALKY